MKKVKFLLPITILLLILLVSSSFLVGCASSSTPSPSASKPAPAASPSPSSNTIRIGVLVALTGWFSSFDVLEWQEAQLAAQLINQGKWLNDTPGITVNGKQYQVEVIPADIQSTATGVASAATKLVYEDKVQFIAGPAAFFASACSNITEPNKVLRAISFTTFTPGEFGKDTPYTFLAHNATLEHAIIAMDYLKKTYPNVKSVVLINADDGAIPYMTPIVKKLLADNGITVMGDTIGFPNEMVDFSPVAAKILSLKPDAMFFVNGLPVHMGSILKLVRAAGSQIPFVTGSSAAGEDVLPVSGKDAASNFCSTGITADLMNDPATTPLMKEIVKQLTATYGKQRSIHLQVFNSIWEINEAIQAAQSFDPTVVKNKWAGMDTIMTPYGAGHIGGLQTYGLNQAVSHPEPVVVLDKGEIKSGGYIDPGKQP
jgi:branched-chain amino acid transport system substrate-binding protein